MRERDVIELIKSRDEGGVSALLTHYGPLMRYVIGPILTSEADREECLSECCMKVWDKIDSYDAARGSWTAWLTAIARNAALNRAGAVRTGIPGLDELPESLPSPEPTPEDAVLERERLETLRRAIAGLNSGERALVFRKYYYFQSTAQIAAELGTTQRAVEGRLHRIRKKLRRELEA